jgi:hypothetical protein
VAELVQEMNVHISNSAHLSYMPLLDSLDSLVNGEALAIRHRLWFPYCVPHSTAPPKWGWTRKYFLSPRQP